MKVTHIAYEHTPNDIRIFRKECIALYKCGYQVSYITSNKSGVEADEYSGVQKIIIPLKNTRYIRLFLYLAKLKTILKCSDSEIFHIHEEALLPLVSFLIKRGKIVIYDAHEVPLEMKSSMNHGAIKKLFIKWLIWYERKAVSKAHYIISVTPSLVRYFKQYNERVAMITNYPLVNSNVNARNVQERLLGFAGVVDSEWHHKEIVEAINQVGNVEYLLAGPRNERYYNSLLQIDGWEKVTFYGYIPHSEVKEKIYDRIAIGLALLRDSNLPEEGTLGNNKLFEFMEQGIPVISSDYSLWREIVEGNQCGVCVDPENVDQIRDAILLLLRNPQMRTEMGQNGRTAVMQKYNWETQRQILLEVYKEVSSR